MKNYVGWVGRMRSISTLLPSLWSVLAPDISFPLTQPIIPTNIRDPGMINQKHYLEGRLAFL